MNLIQSAAWFLQNEGAERLRILDNFGLDFCYLDEKFDLYLDPLSQLATLTAPVFNEDQMNDFEMDAESVIDVINELSKQSKNVSYFFEHDEEKAYARYSFNFRNLDELTFGLLNGCHALFIASETFISVAEGSRVEAHRDWSFVYSEEEEATYQHLQDFLNINLLYVHGFRSSGNSATAKSLQENLPYCKIFAPDLPIDAQDAVELLKHIVNEENIDVVVGTSMGGMLAQKLRNIPKVLVNPSFFVSETFRKNIGTVSYLNERKDGATEFEITPKVVDSYAVIERGQFHALTQREKSITVGAFGNNDEIVDCKDVYLSHYESIVYFAGGHRLNELAIKHRIIPTIARLYRFSRLEGKGVRT